MVNEFVLGDHSENRWKETLQVSGTRRQPGFLWTISRFDQVERPSLRLEHAVETERERATWKSGTRVATWHRWLEFFFVRFRRWKATIDPPPLNDTLTRPSNATGRSTRRRKRSEKKMAVFFSFWSMKYCEPVVRKGRRCPRQLSPISLTRPSPHLCLS